MTKYKIPSTFIVAMFLAFIVSCSPAENVNVPDPSTSGATTIKRDEQRRLLGKLDREDKVAAVALAQKLSDEGDPMAMAYLGACYLDGNNVLKDRAKADKLFEQASASGDAEIDFLIGKTFAHCRCAGNKEAAFSWYSRAASRGHPAATFDLGGMYEVGFGVKVDPAKAFTQFLKAAKLGYPQAMKKVAECYSKGIGIKKNQTLAQEWSARASASVIKQSLPRR